MQRPLIQEPLLRRLSEVIAARMGLHYPRPRWSDLERGISAAAAAFGMDSGEACARWLVSDELRQSHIETLAHYLTIGETYFFREKRSFEVLEQHILPQLIGAAAHRRLRIWSAACATGEEAYSIAMVLLKLIPDLDASRVSILGTDIDPLFLEQARRGVYGRWSFRDAPAGLKSAYFRKTAEGRYEIDPRIRALVTFDYLNLAEEGYPAIDNGTNAMDIVFCRNVLIYFEASRAREVLRKLSRALVEGGWLFLNPVEIPHASLPHLLPVSFPGVTLHRKDSTVSDASADAATSLPRAAPHLPRAQASPATRRDPTRTPGRRQQGHKSAIPRVVGNSNAGATAPTSFQDAVDSYAGGRYPETVRKLLTVLSKAPDDAAAIALLVRAYADQGLLSDARAWCEKALAADRLNATWSYLLATILAEEGHAADAASALKRALYLDPDHALAHFALGNLSSRVGNARDAERHYRNALSILSAFPQDEVLPESGGMTAGRLAEMIRSTTLSGASA